MGKIHEEKEKFCDREFLKLVQAIEHDVLRLEYKLHSSGEETVTIVYLTKAGEYGRTINVTGDSIAALARDVLKYL